MDKVFQNVEVQGHLDVVDGYGAYLKLPVLTTAQRDALIARTGQAIYNSTNSRRDVYNGSEWESLEDGAVVEAKIGTEAVTNAKIGPDAVDGSKVEDDAIDSEHITRKAIDKDHLSDNIATELAMAWTGEVEVKEVRANEKYGITNVEIR